MSIASKKLNKAYRKSKRIKYDSSSKIIIMSDLHRGQGGNNDNFLQNQNIFCAAMEYYFDSGFTYIELGDGDELWENRKMDRIIRANCDVFALISRFYKKNRFYMVYGNHDIVKKKKSFQEKYLDEFYNECEQKRSVLFPNMEIYEGVILENNKNKNEIFLVHGHQGSLLNDVYWRFARFLVRYVWQPLESIGMLSPSGAKGPISEVEKIDRHLSAFARREMKMLICGHTHRPKFPKPGKGMYFNDGGCVHPRYITGIEIENDEISLVKWSVMIKKDRTLYVGREILKGPEKISDYFEKS